MKLISTFIQYAPINLARIITNNANNRNLGLVGELIYKNPITTA